MAVLTTLLSAEMSNLIGKLLISLYNWVGNFGWTVVVFTIFLKLILSPLDVWQRVSMRKQQKKMAELKPKLDKIERQYRNNPNLLKQKQMELQRGASINMLSSCLPMIITMVVFFVVFAGFRALIVYENQIIVEELDSAYVQYFDNNEIKNINGQLTYDYSCLTIEQKTELDTILEETYSSNIQSWLWIKNVFMSDIGTNVIPSLKNFTSSGAGGINATLPDNLIGDYDVLVAPAANKYNKNSFWDVKNWNGYFILPLLSLVISFLSTFLMQKTQPQQISGTKEQQEQQQKTAKMMNYMMPLMLAIFAIMYSAAFAIYYVMSSLLSTLFTLAFNIIIKQIDKKKDLNNNVVISR